ncbi:hypothetical protein BsWGS_24506 [Bradybaena similaris]
MSQAVDDNRSSNSLIINSSTFPSQTLPPTLTTFNSKLSHSCPCLFINVQIMLKESPSIFIDVRFQHRSCTPQWFMILERVKRTMQHSPYGDGILELDPEETFLHQTYSYRHKTTLGLEQDEHFRFYS